MLCLLFLSLFLLPWQMHKTISNLLESYPAELAALMQSPQAEAPPAESGLPKSKKPKTPQRIKNSLEFFSIRQVLYVCSFCCSGAAAV